MTHLNGMASATNPLYTSCLSSWRPYLSMYLSLAFLAFEVFIAPKVRAEPRFLNNDITSSHSGSLCQQPRTHRYLRVCCVLYARSDQVAALGLGVHPRTL